MTCGSTTKVFARFSPRNWKIRHEMDVLLFLRVSRDAMQSYLVRDVLFFVIIGLNFLVVKTPSLVKQPQNHRKTLKITKVCYPLYNILNGEINAFIFEIWVSICLIYSNRQKTENFHRSARSVKSCAVEELPFYSLWWNYITFFRKDLLKLTLLVSNWLCLDSSRAIILSCVCIKP